MKSVRSQLLIIVSLLGLVVFAAACSAEAETAEQPNLFVPAGETTTSVEATTSVPEPAAPEAVPAPIAQPVAEAEAIDPASLEPVTYSTDLHAVFERSCASCHGPDQAGASGIVLATAGDIAENAAAIDLYTTAELMPPWPASSRSIPFHNNPSLTPLEIAQIARWVDDGAELDVAATTPIVPTLVPSYLADPEVIMTSASGAYAGDPTSSDDYRCLIFDPGNSDTEWILGMHFVPDQEDVVHHGIIKLASADLRARADAIDASTTDPGWSCYGGVGLEGRGGELRDMAGWAPGAQPNRLPAGYAEVLEPGEFFVVQIHYHYTGSAPADLSEYHLDLASDEELAAVGGSFKELDQALYLGPAEIPCYAGDTEPLCDRDAALERVRQLYGQYVGAFANTFLSRCGALVEHFAGMTDGDAWSTCDLPVSNPGRIISVHGHMHELGSSIRLTLNPDTPEERILLDIPDWDFEWQLIYHPIDDIVINSGDVIRVDCAWNRERAPYEAVGYILWSDGTGDEMCYSSITTAPLN